MSVIRVIKDSEYAVIKNDILNNKYLSWEARGIMAYLLSKPDKWECRNYDLINQGPSGKHVIQRVLNELQSFGYIRRYRISVNKQENGRGKIEWITEIYEDPKLNTDYRNTENSTVDNSEVRKPGHIVSTDFDKVLTTENQKSPNGGNDDFTDLFPTDSEPTQQPQSSNGKPDMQNLTEADKAHLQTFGFLPDKKPLTYDIRQELLQANWIITITNVEKVIALYILLVRKHRPSFAIPNDISIRKDWFKSIQGHLQDYALDDLPKLYKKALARLDDGKLTYTRPGSLTKILADVASEEPAPKGVNLDNVAKSGIVASY